MPLRVIVDCNVYISLLIGGSMAKLTDHLFSDHVELVLSDKLFAEIEEQIRKTKFKKYFTGRQADSLVQLLHAAGSVFLDKREPPRICRDPDDDYLLALAKTGKADVLLTGDKGLLVLEKHGRTRIMNAREFVKAFLSEK